MIVENAEQLKITSSVIALDEKGVDLVSRLIPLLERELSNSRIKGVGLSAIQIGYPVRLAIIRTTKTSLNLINPSIIEEEDPMVFRGEGCLSFPNIYKDTRRFQQITIENYNLLGEKETFVFEGFEAVAIQHEIDHMNGLVFLDRLQRPMLAGNKIGRNDPCYCGSGKKYKKCCGVV